MKRFIFLSFAFLAWAFYEMSGGADFQPRVATTVPAGKTEIATPPARDDPVKAVVLVSSPAIAPVEPQPAIAVTRVATAEPAIETDPGSPAVPTRIGPGLNLDLNLGLGQDLGRGLPLFPDSDPVAQPMMLASLEQGAAGLTVAAPADPEPTEPIVASAPPADIREIRGTRVNMRDGPGTIYPVITSVTLGQQVEVLGESGTGWLRLRTLPERTTGWIAASLVSKKKR